MAVGVRIAGERLVRKRQILQGRRARSFVSFITAQGFSSGGLTSSVKRLPPLGVAAPESAEASESERLRAFMTKGNGYEDSSSSASLAYAVARGKREKKACQSSGGPSTPIRSSYSRLTPM